MSDAAKRSLPEAIEAACYEKWFEHPPGQRAHAEQELRAAHPEWSDEIATLMSRLQTGAGLLELADPGTASSSVLVPGDGSADAPEASPPPPAIGGYEILEPLGSGGFGRVYRARQLQPVDREVAIKVLRVSAMGERAQARFALERQALARMQHASVAGVLDAGRTADGRPFFAMEFVAGRTIRDYCDSERLTVAERVALIAQVGRGLEHAHQRGVIHRDLKPTNVLVRDRPEGPLPVLIDFGLAKAIDEEQDTDAEQTIEGSFVGTPFYASPEQAAGERADTRTDVYGLGLLLYELLTGDVPHGAARLKSTTVREALRIVSEEEPRSLSRALRDHVDPDGIANLRALTPAQLAKLLQGDLDSIVRCAVARDPAERYGSAGAMVADLERYLDGLPIIARRHTWTYLLGKFWRRHRLAVTGAALFVLTVIGATVAVVWGATRLAEEQQRTEREQNRARHGEYTLGIRAAKLALDRNSPADALEHLDRLPTGPGNWEFDYLHRHAQPGGEVIDVGAGKRTVSALVWLPTGNLVVGFEAPHHCIEVWNPATRELVRSWTDLPASVLEIWALGSDQLCAFVSRGGWGQLLRLTGDKWTEIATAPERAKAAISRDREHWVLADWNGIRFGRFDSTAIGRAPWKGLLNSVEFGLTPDEVLVGARHGRVVRVALADPTGKEPTTLVPADPDGEYDHEIRRMHLVHSRRELLVARDRKLAVRDADTGKLRYEIELPTGPRRLAEDPTTGIVLLGGGWGRALVTSLDLDTGRTPGKWNGHRNGVFALAVEPNGERFATAGVDGEIRIWNQDAPTDARTDVLGWDCRDLAISPDGEFAAFGDDKHALGVMHLATGKRTMHTKQVGGRARGEKVAFDGTRIFVAGFDGGLRTYARKDGRLLAEQSLFARNKRTIDLTLSTDGRRLFAISFDAAEAVMLAAPAMTELWRIELTAGHRSWFAPDGERLFVADFSHRLFAFDRETGRQLSHSRFEGVVYDLAWTPDEQSVVVCLRTGHATLCRADNLEPLRSFPPHTLSCFAAAVSPDGTRLATGGPGDATRILDFETGTKLLELDCPPGNLIQLFWSRDGRSLSARMHEWRAPSYLIRWDAGPRD
ncbi:MAG: WD40 repeat domain-containing serine/threonine-protein kinase [bacterium]|nr:WD40 repeat domain-containing serine/threonine-protein kinase [bacterium]